MHETCKRPLLSSENAYLPKISILLQLGDEILALLCFDNILHTTLHTNPSNFASFLNVWNAVMKLSVQTQMATSNIFMLLTSLKTKGSDSQELQPISILHLLCQKTFKVNTDAQLSV